MKNILLILVIASTISGNPSEPSPSPYPYYGTELWPAMKESAVNYPEYQSYESSIKAFNELVKEIITPGGEILEGTDDMKVGFVEWMVPILLAEQRGLRGRKPKTAIKEFGEPNRILKVRKEVDLFDTFIPSGFGWGMGYKGEPCARFTYKAPLECYEYDNLYVWMTSRDAHAEKVDEVLAISPRSTRYDQYINNLDPFEKQDD